MVRQITFILIAIILFNGCKENSPDEVEDTAIPESFFSQLTNAGSLDLDMAMDKNNGIYITGTTTQTTAGENLDFGGLSIRAEGLWDAFVVKYDQSGKALWAKILGNSNVEQGKAIAVDDDGNVYVAGIFTDSTVIDGTKLKTKKLFNSGGGSNLSDTFLAKFDKNGKQIWVKQISGVGYETPSSIKINKQGKIIVTGQLFENIYFDKTSYSVNGSGFFVACYNPGGALEWAKTYGSTINMVGRESIYASNMKLTKNDEIVIVGSYEGTKRIGGSVVNSSGDQDVFITKLDVQGNVIWVKTFGGIGTEYCMGVSIDDDESICVGGFFRGPLTIDNHLFDPPGEGGDSFIVKLNPSGLLIWATQISGADEKSTYDIVSNKSKTLVTGYFYGTAHFGFGDSTLISKYSSTGFVAQYSNTGAFEKVESLGNSNAIGRRILVDKNDYMLIFGYFNTPYIFNNSTYTSKNGINVFLVKFK